MRLRVVVVCLQPLLQPVAPGSRRGYLTGAEDVTGARVGIIEDLTARVGVHRPSRFSALLASALPDCTGRTVIDAGAGSGLITLAAFIKGAAKVIAVDHDPAALLATTANVTRLLGNSALARIQTVETGIDSLDAIPGDLLAVNPPQRPQRLLAAVEADQRHLHEGGGPDGLATLRLVLAYAPTDRVWSTAAAILPITALAVPHHDGHRTWTPTRTMASAELTMHPSWHAISPPTARVDVREFLPVPRRDATYSQTQPRT